MKRKTNSLWSLGEPLLLGLSCVVGGEQFYLLLYGTGRSVRGQSFVLVFTAIITCVLSAAISSRTDVLAHFFHLFYMYMIILQMTIANELTGWIIATIVTIGLGYALAMLVIQSCSLYSNSREELLTFIIGMLSARYIPCFLRLFLGKGCTCDSGIRNLSKALGISRLVFCIVSLVLKVLLGRFKLTYRRPSIEVKIESPSRNGQSGTDCKDKNNRINIFQASLWSNQLNDIKKIFEEIKSIHETSLKQGFQQILEHTKYLIDTKIINEAKPDNLYSRGVEAIIKLIPIFMFLTSVLIFLMYPKTSFSGYCSYSPKLISKVINVKYVSHIIGSMFGIEFPVSVTANSALFTTITFFFYYLVLHYLILTDLETYLEEHFLYFIIGSSSFVLGYMWSYNLGLIINMVIGETCIYEEVEIFDFTKLFSGDKKVRYGNKRSCCGDKITSECYCKLEKIVDIFNSNVSYDRMFDCSKLYKENARFRYSKYGECAILLMYNTDDSNCCQECTQCCSGSCSNNCCLKIIGKYRIDAVTVSSCSDCQLTIRLEGKCEDSSKCPTTSGIIEPSNCSGAGNNCCCICVKCCSTSPPGCCIHLCKNGKCSCSRCGNSSYARLFICYKTNDEKCCIKEIRPNDKADFVGDLKVKNQFDIQEIFISDCCHVDVRIDLRCAVKNNYFRSGANYPRKFDKTDIVRLLWSESICCPITGSRTQCCCIVSQLVRGYIHFLDESVKCMNIEICNITCNCPNGSKCCLMPCYLEVDEGGGFVKRVDRIRVKLIVISWLLFGLVFFFVVLIASIFRSKYSPVTFYPMTSYSKLAGTFATNKYNSNDQVTARIVGLLVNGKISDETIDAKKVELKAMLRMFAKYSTIQETKKTKKRKPKEVEKIRKYITSKAASFTPSTSIGGRACEMCVVEWSQCVGLVYKYAMPLFFFIQNFFISWEEAWKIDFYNYKKQIKTYVTKVTHNSRTSLSTVMSEVSVGGKSNEMGLKRLMTWNGTSKETKKLSQVKMEEDNMINDQIPPKIGNRLCYYVRRWNHRLYNIRNWCQFDSNIFDWVRFLNEYYKIREWVTDVSPGLRCDSEVKVSIKDLNKGIKIFIATM